MNCLPLNVDPHAPKRLEAEDELWPVMAELLIEVPRSSHVVIGATGKTAVMGTISLASFVEFKRRRNALQAQTVQGLMDENVLLAACCLLLAACCLLLEKSVKERIKSFARF